MKNLRLILSFLLCLVIFTCSAQGNKYELSAPTGLSATGWNKVLCLKNGNTLLFHFEPLRGIVVKVYDSLHKLTGTQKHICGRLDINKLKTSLFKGLFEIGGDAVLFIEQEHQGRHQLVRLRFDGRNGALNGEEVIGESEGIGRPEKFYVLRDKTRDDYAVLFSNDLRQFNECDVYLSIYNNNHTVIKHIPLDIKRKNYDYLDIAGAEWQPGGICISVSLAKLILSGSLSHQNDYDPVVNVYDHHLALFYIPDDSFKVKEKVVDVTKDIYPFCTNFTLNNFAGTLNLLLLSYTDAIKRNGVELQPTNIMATYLFTLDKNSLGFGFKKLKNSIAVAPVFGNNSNIGFDGLPSAMFTNENGLTTVISSGFCRNFTNIGGQAAMNLFGADTFTHHSLFDEGSLNPGGAIHGRLRGDTNRYHEFNEGLIHPKSNVYETYLNTICITQLDDSGSEIWGVILPWSQYFRSYDHYYYTFFHESKRWQEQYMFEDMPPQVYDRQFHSYNTYVRNKNIYIIFNDYNQNLNNTLEKPGDTVFDFALTNTFCYKINRKKEITKTYLFGTPRYKEYKSSFIESAALDEQRGIYATLVQYKKGTNTDLRMAWATLD